MSDQTNRKIKEKDAETIRSQRQKYFSNDFNNLVRQAPNLSESTTKELAGTLEKFYNIDGQTAENESISLLDNISYLSSYENANNTSPPQLHVLQNKKRRNYTSQYEENQ